jgi:hypothetical protein
VGPTGGHPGAAEEDQLMNEDAEAIRRMLEAEKTRGRSSAEAAGIALYVGIAGRRSEILSEETRQDADAVILRWLRAEAGDESAAHELVVRQFAECLIEHIDNYAPEHPQLKVERALREWREERQA